MTEWAIDWRELFDVCLRLWAIFAAVLVLLAHSTGEHGLIPYIITASAATVALGALIGAWLWGRE